MDENLVGYLLNAIEPDEQRAIQKELRENAETRRRLELVRQALEPLAADAEASDPPAGLWVRTLARVAEHRCRNLPHAPSTLTYRPAASRLSWRRADALAAAGILLCLGLLVPPALNYVRYRSEITECQNNMRGLHAALVDYSQRHHGDFPDVARAAPEPRNVAGLFVSMLNEDHALPASVKVICPAIGKQPVSCLSLEQVKQLRPEEFAYYVHGLAGCYAYSLGYVDSDGIHGLRLEPVLDDSAYLPILADRAPAGVDQGDPGNSPNHGGYGQNVLYVDGHSRFCKKRTVGYGADDIFVNFDNKVAAGKMLWDTVLANSAAQP